MTLPSDEIIELARAEQMAKEVLNWNVRDDCKGLTVEQIREKQPKLGFAVALLNVAGGLNVGSMIRTSVIHGADKVYLIGPNKRYDRRSTVGAHNYIDIEFIQEDLSIPMHAAYFHDRIRDHGYIPTVIEQGGDDIREPRFKRYQNRCLIFGSEADGVPAALMNMCSRYEIAQKGVIRSLNVSAACAIVLHEYTRDFE